MYGQTNHLDFASALSTFDKTKGLFASAELKDSLDSSRYIGLAPELVDRALKLTRDENWLTES